MTTRLRIVVVVAILFALGGHFFAHPVVKECPCVHDAGAVAAERSDSFVLPLLAERHQPDDLFAADDPAVRVRSSRAPPAA